MKTKLLHAFIAAAVLVPAAAAADPAVTTQSVNMRAGPGVSYPVVAYLAPNLSVDVAGCVAGYQWCDVIAGPNRGWVYAAYLSSYYNNAPIALSSGAPYIGIPLITFSIGSYWDSYYRGRPWWNDRAYWYDRHNHEHGQGQHYVQAPRHYGPGRDGQANRGHEWHGASASGAHPRHDTNGGRESHFANPGHEAHGSNGEHASHAASRGNAGHVANRGHDANGRG